MAGLYPLSDSAGRLPLIYLDDGFHRHRLTRSPA
jgi:hypothetical protein